MTDFPAFMLHGGWAIYALMAAAIAVISFLANQYLKQPGHLLVFWSRTATVVLMAPFMMHITLPTDPMFFFVVSITALLGAFADIRALNVAAKFGGGIVAGVQPLVIILSFLLWFAFDPALLKTYIARPLNTALILLALAGVVYFSTHLRKCNVSRSAFVEMLPALLGYTVTAVLNKHAMSLGPLEGAVYGYMFVQSAVAVVLTGVYAGWRQRRAVAWNGKIMSYGAVIVAVAWVGSMTFKNYALAFTPNPSYQAALGQVTPVFIALVYKLTGHKEEGNVAAGMGIVAACALLTLATIH